MEEIKKKSYEFLQSIEEYKNMEIVYILFDKKDKDNIIVTAFEDDEIVQLNLKNKEFNSVWDWAYSIDEEIFESLEKDMLIGYMNMEMHYNIWSCIEELYPEDINYKKGLQMYLKYCNENNISKESIENCTKQNVVDVMKYYTQLEENKEERSVFDNNMKILKKGYRRLEPIALVERYIENEKEFIIAFNYEIKNNKLDWAYGYYYDDNIEKATKDYQKVIEGGNLADTFIKKNNNAIKSIKDKER